MLIHTVHINLEDIIKDITSKSLKVGWDKNATHDDGTPVSMVAYQNEFGNMARNIPPRPFMRPAVDNNTWSKQFSLLLKPVLRGNSTATTAFKQTGLIIEGDIKQAITEVTAPALAQSTIKARQRRGSNSTKPLQDTGVMIRTVSNEVKDV